MDKINLDETYIFQIRLKCSFDVTIGIKILFFYFGYYWAGSLLTTLPYHELFDRSLLVFGNEYLNEAYN